MSTNQSYFEELEKEYGRLSFGATLKAIRETEGWTQSLMAKKLGISVQNLCDIEKERRIPSPARASKMAKKLKMPEAPFIELVIRDDLWKNKLRYEVTIEKSA